MITKKQHFIPVMLLKRFAIDSDKRKILKIFAYNKSKHEEHIVSVRNVCYAKNLYETKNKDNTIMEENRNQIENHLAKLEQDWNNILVMVEERRELSGDDISNLRLLTAIQILRMPGQIEEPTSLIKNHCPSVEEYVIDKYVKDQSLIVDGMQSGWMQRSTLNVLEQYKLDILHSKKTFILSERCPVIMIKDFNDQTVKYIYFPISKNVCLRFSLCHGYDRDNVTKLNIDGKFVKRINSFLYSRDGEMIYGCESIQNRLKARDIVNFGQILA